MWKVDSSTGVSYGSLCWVEDRREKEEYYVRRVDVVVSSSWACVFVCSSSWGFIIRVHSFEEENFIESPTTHIASLYVLVVCWEVNKGCSLSISLCMDGRTDVNWRVKPETLPFVMFVGRGVSRGEEEEDERNSSPSNRNNKDTKCFVCIEPDADGGCHVDVVVPAAVVVVVVVAPATHATRNLFVCLLSW